MVSPKRLCVAEKGPFRVAHRSRFELLAEEFEGAYEIGDLKKAVVLGIDSSKLRAEECRPEDGP